MDWGVVFGYLDANPALRELYPDPQAAESAIVMRNLIDGLQDMYFLRKRGIIGDHHWRNRMAAFAPVARIAMTRQIFENAATRDALEPEFAMFLRPIFDGQPLADPKPSA